MIDRSSKLSTEFSLGGEGQIRAGNNDYLSHGGEGTRAKIRKQSSGRNSEETRN